MEYEYVTAEWAKKRSKELLEIIVSAELEDILSSIEDAVEGRKDCIYIVSELEFETLGELEKRGFKIEDNSRDGTYDLKLTWKN